jgi:transcriptional regulator with GAF, ATPase, and Fis domain
VLLSQGDTIGPHDIVIGQSDPMDIGSNRGMALPVAGIDMHQLENSLVVQALTRSNNNQTHAARLLGLSRDALRYRMEKLGLLK